MIDYLLKGDLSIGYGGKWQQLNGVSGYLKGEEQSCPFTVRMIRISKQLGLSEEDLGRCNFCGVWQVRVDDIEPMAGRRGVESRPDMYCRRLLRILMTILNSIKGGAGLPISLDKGKIVLKIEAADMDELRKIVLTLPNELFRYELYEKYFSSRSVLYAELSSLYNGIFSQREMDLEEIINPKQYLSDEPLGCNQHPREGFAGMYS